MILYPNKIHTLEINKQAEKRNAIRFDKGSASIHLSNYPHSGHYKPLLRFIADIEKRVNKRSIDLNNIIITHGALHGLFLSLTVLCNRNDYVLINNIAFEGIHSTLKLLNLKTICCNYIKDNLESVLIKYRPKIMILNSPENPSGYIYTKEELSQFGKLSIKYGFIIISDEVNNQNIYEPYSYIPPCLFIQKRSLISLNSFSKNYFLSSLRIGWIICPRNIGNKIQELIISTEIGVSNILQKTTFQIIRKQLKKIERMKRIISIKKNACESILKNAEYIKPIQSGSVIFLKCKVESKVIASKLLKEKNIAVVPGIFFGKKWKNWIRVGFSSVPKKDLVKFLQTIINYSKLGKESYSGV